MVWVEHTYPSGSLKKEVEGPVRILLANRRGGYLSIPSFEPSKYDGFFIFDRQEREMYKILEPSVAFASLKNSQGSACTENATYQLFPNTDTLIIHPTSSYELNLDIRKSYDLREWGRIYTVTQDKQKIVVEFNKKTDLREDQTENQTEFSMFLVIRHNGIHALTQDWIKSTYPSDMKRSSPPYERYIFHLAKINAAKIVITASKTMDAALAESELLFQKKHRHIHLPIKISGRESIDYAYSSALASLDNHILSEGIIAGFPWFFQFWSRDESISLGALISEKRYELAKKLLFRQLDHLLPDGRIPNQIPSGGIGSADSNGWCFLRLKQLEELGQLTKIERVLLLAKLEYLLPKLSQNHIKEGFVTGAAKETWMDTDIDGDNARAGVRLEIQTLQVAFYRFLQKLTNHGDIGNLSAQLKEKVKSQFWNGSCLADGIGDFTVRPNIFLAYYSCPDLLSAEEWKTCFDTALGALWLDWGGLSTIDKSNSLFCPYHTGQDNRSYHHGDSWYWINNIAALCMYRLDKDRYSYQIHKIIDASSREILWMGAIGSHAELSSAAKQESFGCASQAWSLGTYIELINELYPISPTPKGLNILMPRISR